MFGKSVARGRGFVLLVLAGLCLAGCTTTQGSHPIAQGLVAPSIPQAQPIATQPVRWKVYNTSDLRKLVAAHPERKGVVLMALTPQGYQALASNMTEIERYMREQGEVILTYKQILKDREQGGTPARP